MFQMAERTFASSTARTTERHPGVCSSLARVRNTWRDMAVAAVRTLRLTPVMHELAAARSQPVARSDVFVGIYWQRYGWTSDVSAASAVEDDYLRCGEVPRLVYVKQPAPAREPELDRLTG